MKKTMLAICLVLAILAAPAIALANASPPKSKEKPSVENILTVSPMILDVSASLALPGTSLCGAENVLMCVSSPPGCLQTFTITTEERSAAAIYTVNTGPACNTGMRSQDERSCVTANKTFNFAYSFVTSFIRPSGNYILTLPSIPARSASYKLSVKHGKGYWQKVSKWQARSTIRADQGKNLSGT